MNYCASISQLRHITRVENRRTNSCNSSLLLLLLLYNVLNLHLWNVQTPKINFQTNGLEIYAIKLSLNDVMSCKIMKTFWKWRANLFYYHARKIANKKHFWNIFIDRELLFWFISNSLRIFTAWSCFFFCYNGNLFTFFQL